MAKFTAAVVQSAPVVFDLEGTLSKLQQLTQAAAKTGAKLVVFPEAFVSAYPKGWISERALACEHLPDATTSAAILIARSMCRGRRWM